MVPASMGEETDIEQECEEERYRDLREDIPLAVLLEGERTHTHAWTGASRMRNNWRQ